MPEAVAANARDTAIDKNKVVRMINCFNCVSFYSANVNGSNEFNARMLA